MINATKSLFTLTRLDYKTNKDSYNNVDSPEPYGSSQGTFSQSMTFDKPKMKESNSEKKKATQGYEAHLRPPKTKLKPAAEAMLKSIQKQTYEETYKKFCMLYMLDSDVSDAKWRLGEATGEIEPIHIFKDEQGKLTWPNQFTKALGKEGRLITRTLGDVSVGKNLQTIPLLGLPPYTSIIDDDDSGDKGYSLKDGSTDNIVSIRKPGFKQINEVINVLQGFESKIIGTIPTYLNEWDLSMYIQENIAEVNQNNGKNWLAWPTHLFYRIEKDSPLESIPTKNVANAPVPKTDPLSFLAYANMNASISAIYRDYAPNGTMNEIYHPEAFPLSKWWVNPISCLLDMKHNISDIWQYQSGKAFRKNAGTYKAQLESIGARMVEEDITDINHVLISPKEYLRFMDEMCEALCAYNITDTIGNVKSDPLYDIPFYRIFYDSPSAGASELELIYEGLNEQQTSRSDLMRDILLTLTEENEPFFNSIRFDPDNEIPKTSSTANTDPVRSIQTQYASESDIKIMKIPIPGSRLLKMFLKRSSIQSKAEAAGRNAKNQGSASYNSLADITEAARNDNRLGNSGNIDDPTAGTSQIENGEDPLESEDLYFSFGTGPGMLQYSPFMFGGPHSRCDDPYALMGWANHSNANARSLFRPPTNEDKHGYLNYRLTDYASGQEDFTNNHQYTYAEFPNYSPLPTYCGDIRNTDHSTEMFQRGYLGDVTIQCPANLRIDFDNNGRRYIYNSDTGSMGQVAITKPAAAMIYNLLSMPNLKLTLKPKSDNSQDRGLMAQYGCYDSRSMYDASHKNFDSLGIIDKWTDRRMKDWFDGFMISRANAKLVPIYMTEGSSWKGEIGHHYTKGYGYWYEIDYTLGRIREYHLECDGDGNPTRLYYEYMNDDKDSDEYGDMVEKDVSWMNGSTSLIYDLDYKDDPRLNSFDSNGNVTRHRDGYPNGAFVKQSEGIYYKVTGKWCEPDWTFDEFDAISNEAINNLPQEFKTMRDIMTRDPNNQFITGHIDTVVELSKCYTKGRTGSGRNGHNIHLWRGWSNWGAWMYDDEELLSTYIQNNAQVRRVPSDFEMQGSGNKIQRDIATGKTLPSGAVVPDLENPKDFSADDNTGNYGAYANIKDNVNKPAWSTVRYIDPEFHEYLRQLYEGGLRDKRFTVTFKFGGGKEAPVLISLNLHIVKEMHDEVAYPLDWNISAPFSLWWYSCGCHNGWVTTFPFKAGSRYVFGKKDLYYLVAEWPDIKDMRVNISKFFSPEDIIEVNKGGADHDALVRKYLKKGRDYDFIDEYSFENYKSGYIYSIFNPWNTKNYSPQKYMSPMKIIGNVETIYGVTAWGFDINVSNVFFTSIDYICRYGKTYKYVGSSDIQYQYDYVGPTADFTDHTSPSVGGIIAGATTGLLYGGLAGAFIGGVIGSYIPGSFHCSELGWREPSWWQKYFGSDRYSHGRRRENHSIVIKPASDIINEGDASAIEVDFNALIERGQKDVNLWIWNTPGIVWSDDPAGAVKISAFKNYKMLARDIMVAEIKTRIDTLTAFKESYGEITPRILVDVGKTVIDPKVWLGSINPDKLQIDKTKLKNRHYRDNLYYDPMIEFFYKKVFNGGYADEKIGDLVDYDIAFLESALDAEFNNGDIEQNGMAYMSDLKMAYNTPLFALDSFPSRLSLYLLFYLRVLYYWRRFFLFKRMNKTDGTFHNMMHMEKVMEYSEKAKHQKQDGPEELDPFGGLTPLPVAFFDIQNSLNDKLETLANIETNGKVLERDYATVVYTKVRYVRSLEIDETTKKTYGWDITHDTAFVADTENPGRGTFKGYDVRYINEVGRWALIPTSGLWRLVSKEYNDMYDSLVEQVDNSIFSWIAPIETIKESVFRENGGDYARVCYEDVCTKVTELWNLKRISKKAAESIVLNYTVDYFEDQGMEEKDAEKIFADHSLGCTVYKTIEAALGNPNLSLTFAQSRKLLIDMIDSGLLNDFDKAKEEKNLQDLEDAYDDLLSKTIGQFTYEWHIDWDPYQMSCNGEDSIDERQAEGTRISDLVAAKNKKDSRTNLVKASISFDVADSLAIGNILNNANLYQSDDLQEMSCLGIDRNDYWYIKVPKEKDGTQIKPLIDIMQNEVFITYMGEKKQKTLEEAVLGKMSRTLSPVRVMAIDTFEPPALQSIKAFDAL